MSEFPQIIVGTYEEFLLGYKIQKLDDSGYKLVQSFATHAHQASIRSIAAHGKVLSSSGADEYINMYDMVSLEETGVLSQYSGTVTCLEFTPDGSHLISACQDGSIAIFRCVDWKLVKLWKECHKHANGVVGLSVHPTGKILLSIGADNTIRFWNLVKGRQAYASNLTKKCTVGNSLNHVKWSIDGECYAIAIGKFVEVYLVDTAAVIYQIECEVKVSSLDFGMNDILCIGTEEGVIELHSLKTKSKVFSEKCHDVRTKCIRAFCLPQALTEQDAKDRFYLVSADSKGCIKFWRIKKKKSVYSLQFRCEVTADCRITCMTLVHMNKEVKLEGSRILEEPSVSLVKEKRKRTDSDTLPSPSLINPQPSNGENQTKKRKVEESVPIAKKKRAMSKKKKVATGKKKRNIAPWVVETVS